MKRTTFLIAMLVTMLLVGCQSKHLNVVSLKIEMQENPQGIATLNPRFSWQIISDVPDVVQQSYRIQVAQTKEDLAKEQNLLWDSGDVNSDQSILIPYEGSELASRGIYYWRVKVNTNQAPQMVNLNFGNGTIERYRMQANGLAKTLCQSQRNNRSVPAWLLVIRNRSYQRLKIKRAHSTFRGWHEAFLNGKRISKMFFSHSFVYSGCIITFTVTLIRQVITYWEEIGKRKIFWYAWRRNHGFWITPFIGSA